MAVLTTKGRKHIKPSNFVFPKDKRYPIHDITHARNALARSSGKPEEAAVKKAVYAKYPSLKAAECKLTDIIVRGQIELSDEAGKWYKVLSVGQMHSKKYNGVWDVDNYSCEPGAGVIEVKLNFLDAIYRNFMSGKNETVPFVDIDHESGISLGPITGCKVENGSLYIQPQWNTKGLETVQNKEYMYFSVTLTNHIDSKTGLESFPVMATTSLTNSPVFKDQDVIELSEGKPTGKRPKNINGGPTMDELKELFEALAEKCKSALEGDETGVAKAMIHALIENLETETGTEDGDEDEEGENLEESEKKVLPAQKPEMTPGQKEGPAAPVQMSDNEVSLSEQNIKLAERVKSMELKLAENDFDRKYLNTKVLPAQKAAMFALYCSDKKNAEIMLNAMPDLGVKGVRGSDSDLNLSTVETPAEARKIFDAKVLALSEKEKIDSISAASKVIAENPDLYKKAYSISKGGI